MIELAKPTRGRFAWTRSHALRLSIVALDAWCVVALALPASVLARPALGAAGRLPDFAEEAASMGLVAAAAAVADAGVTAGGQRVLLATASAAAPPGYAATPVFFHRRSSFQIEDAAGDDTPIVESELFVGEQDGHVTIDAIDRVPRVADGVAGPSSALAGLEIHRRVELDIAGFDALVAAVTGHGAPDHDERPALLARLLDGGQIELSNLRHDVTVHYPDGRERVHPGDEFDLAELIEELGLGAGAGTTIYDCYAEIGVDLTIFGAACLVAGVVVCAVACAVSAGIACIPCISGASLACGLGAAVGSLGFCLAKVLFGVDPPPTATPIPTSTRTPTATPTPGTPGDCDGDARVTTAELITAVRVALGWEEISLCRSLDFDRDGQISIDELIAAVHNALAV